MKLFQRSILASAALAFFLTACESVPKAGPSNTDQTVKADVVSNSYELVNRSQVVATVKSKAVAVDLGKTSAKILCWGATQILAQ